MTTSSRYSELHGCFSGTLFFLSLCVSGAVVVASSAWYEVVAVQPDTWGAFLFRGLACVVAIGSVLLVLIPGAILYRRWRRRLDLVSLFIVGAGRSSVCGICGAAFYST
jgi:hypothetical protein